MLGVRNKQICIFIGPPGSGKGSLSALCVKRLGFMQLSTGNLCREHIAEGTDIGKKIAFAIKSGKLISDSLIIDMVNQWIIDNQQKETSLIFDGFPRTCAQAQALHELLEVKFSSSCRIYIMRLQVSNEDLMKRVINRMVCKNNKCQAVYSVSTGSIMQCQECFEPLIKRSDDTEESMRDRLEFYYKHERELLDYYKSISKKVFTFCGGRPLEQVFIDLENLLAYDYD